MILLFLHDWRSVLVVVSNIPLALTGSLFGLWATGNTINIMSLGGMALAIGILVDEATVTIENTRVQMQSSENIATAALRANQATAVPRLLALLCILSVFIPAFVMNDPLRSLFMPPTLGVGFAMISSYLLSSTLVPILSVYLLKHKEHPAQEGEQKPSLFDRMLQGYGKIVDWFIRLRWWVVLGYFVGCGLILGLIGLEVGTELFPQIDAGEFVLRFRPPAGSSYELTREMGVKCLQEIEREAGSGNIVISLGFVGQVAPNFGIDNMVLFMRGPDDGWLRLKLKEDSGIRLDEFRERLRKALPERVVPWIAERLETGGVDKEEAQQKAVKCTFGFEPGDTVVLRCASRLSTKCSSNALSHLLILRSHVTNLLRFLQSAGSHPTPGDYSMNGGSANPTVFAMRHPITTLMLVVGLISGGVLAYFNMRVDIFPALNVPKIYVFLDYVGMSPDQMEGFIVNELELYFQYVDGIQDIKSRNIQQVALCELSFFPGTDMGQAMAQVVAMSDRSMSWMPKGTLPPMIMRMDAGSVPVGYLVMESEVTSLGKMGDLAQNVIRPLVQKYVPGTVAISPFGPNMRSIVINVDPQKLAAYNLMPQHVVEALATENTVVPAGNVYIKDTMPIVANNATVNDPKGLYDIPLKLGANVYIRDVATVQDATDITYGYALVNGKKSVYLPIIKKDTGSTLTVVADVHKSMQLFRDAVPEDVKISFQFDESPTVIAAVKSVATEGAIGAGLTGLMILLFLRDLRSVIVVVCNIPLALLGSLLGLWLSGNTINIMSLGGMALAIGILVDEATVTIENVHVQMGHTKNIATAVLDASNATAVPRLLALLCILSVFIPAFLMKDPLRALFMPLTLGVGFAMISSYLLSSTFVPILCVYLLKPAEHGHEKRGLFDLLLAGYGKAVHWFVHGRWLTVPAYLAGCVLILGAIGLRVGTELFPQIDSGEFVLRFRPPPGSNFELTRQMAIKCLEEIEREAGGPDDIEITMGFVGQVAPNFGINNMALFMRGPDDGQLRIAFREGAKIKLDEFRENLRKALPQRVVPWMAKRLEQGGWSETEALAQAQKSTFGFEPGDIVTEVMSFGSSTPIAVRLVGTDLHQVRRHAEKIAGKLKNISFLRDVHFEQLLDYPSIEVEIDREKAGLSGITPADVGKALVMATSSTRFRSLNYWIEAKTGFDYLVQIQMPPTAMTSPQDVERLPLAPVNPLVNLTIRDVAKVSTSVRPGELDRDMSQRYLTLTANVEGEDMGRASRQVEQAIAAAGDPPRGVRVETMGQLPAMVAMFQALGVGLAAAVFVIVVLLTAYFQSLRLALISIGAVPGVLAGIAVILYTTGTSLNIESFMGSIMCLGVSVSNSVMLVTFMNEHWKSGTPPTEAAIIGASERLRPILMTACAMTVGMVPMALALERGSQMQAPLGRAVIGGLVMSTFATLLVVPSIFAVVIGLFWTVSRSVSIYPADPDSSHFDPLRFAPKEELAPKVEAEAVVVEAHRVPLTATHLKTEEHIRTADGGPTAAASPDGTSQAPPSPGDN
jgi:multidrug efflux pump subunit AcrB